MSKLPDANNHYNTFEKNLFILFSEYLESVITSFRQSHTKTLYHLNIIEKDIEKIEKLESEKEFYLLTKKIMRINSPYLKTQLFWKNEQVWRHAIQSFFRRSTCYNNIFKNQTINTNELFSKYLKSFKNEKEEITYYALIELVNFSKKEINCGSFNIRRFSVSELDFIFSKDISETFYRYALVDSTLLQNYWFMCVSEENEKFDEFSLEVDTKVRFDHSKFPKPLELALKRISLYDWYSDFYERWEAPQISYVFKVTSNLLSTPSSVFFDYRKLLTQPHIVSDSNEEIDVPITIINFSPKEIIAFEEFMLQLEFIFLNLLKVNINFIDNALGHFIKAFFSGGIEQLLWHTSTIEALLGNKTQGLTANLARRAALIIEKEGTKRKNINNQFKKIYDFRSKLVHGNPEIVTKSPDTEHLNMARNISRNIMLWFLYYISKNIEDYKNEKSEKIQTKIIDFIDLEPENIFRT
jgi:hypothetical protein